MSRMRGYRGLVTSENHFEGLPEVVYFKKQG